MRLVGDSANAFPDYPQIMAAVGVDGRVEVDFVVTPDGTVDTASVTIRSLTNRAFVRNTMQAIDQWRFVALDDPGPLVPMTYSVLVKYQLGKERCTVSYFAVIRRVWSMSGGRPVATVTACQPRLVPRDQIRPMNGPGN
jgi:TonB family protein